MAKNPHAELIKQMVDDDSLRVTYGIEDTTYEAMSVLVYPEYDWRDPASQLSAHIWRTKHEIT